MFRMTELLRAPHKEERKEVPFVRSFAIAANDRTNGTCRMEMLLSFPIVWWFAETVEQEQCRLEIRHIL